MIQSFNVNKAINKCNQLGAKQYPLNKDFGLVCLHVKVLQELTDACEQLNNPIALGDGKSVLQKLVDEESREAYQWYESVQKHYQQANKAQQVDVPIDLIRLQGAAIWELASKTLVRVSFYASLANYELIHKKKRFPEVMHAQVTQYVQQLEGAIQQWQQKICALMLIRLQSADSTGDLHCDDALWYLAQSMASAQISVPNRPDGMQYQKKLTAQQFDDFQSYILVHGSKQQQAHLRQLSWLKSDLRVKAVYNEHRVRLIPDYFMDKNLVPTLVIFRWFAPWAYFRSTFFSENVRVFAQIKRLLVGDARYEIKNYQDLARFLQIIRQADDALRSLDRECELRRPGGILKFLNRKMLDFSNGWRQFSREQHSDLQSLKIKLIEQYSNDVELRCARDDAEQAVLFNEELQQTKRLIQDSRESVVDGDCHLRLNQCEQKIDELIERFDIEVVIETDPPVFEQKIEPLVNNEQQLGVIAAVENLDTLSIPKEDFEKICEQVEPVKKSCDRKVKTALGDALEVYDQKLFVRYLKTCLASLCNPPSDEQVERLSKVEQLLLKEGSDDVVSRVRELAQLRANPKRAFIFRIKCFSFLKSYGEDVASEVTKKPFILINACAKKEQAEVKGKETFISFDQQPAVCTR